MDLKSASDLLLKGGTLLSDSCDVCRGLLIKYDNNIYCLTCKQDKSKNNDSKIINETSSSSSSFTEEKISENALSNSSSSPSSGLIKTIAILEQKIVILANDLLRGDIDICKQKEILELMNSYLKTYSKIKKII